MCRFDLNKTTPICNQFGTNVNISIDKRVKECPLFPQFKKLNHLVNYWNN